MRESPLREQLREANSHPAQTRWDVVEMRFRFPRALRKELKALAESEGLSVNGLVSAFIDSALVERGRKPIPELAPWFAAYLHGGKKGNPPIHDVGDDPDFT